MFNQHHPTARPGLRPSQCRSDLRSVLDAGWVRYSELQPGEGQLATTFYAACAPAREHLAAVQRAAQTACEQWTGKRPHPMGSSYAGTALGSSDIDLYTPLPEQCRNLDDLRDLLAGRADYRKTRPGPTGEDRHLFCYTEGTTRVDLNFVPPSDYRLALTVVHEIAAGLTTEDRIAHTWIKHLVYEQGDQEAYGRWKTAMRLRMSPTLRALMAPVGKGSLPASADARQTPGTWPPCCSAA